MSSEEEMWKEIGRPVTEFADSIKDMKLNVDKLIQFYRKHVQGDRDLTGNQHDVPMDQDQPDCGPTLSPLAVAKLQLAIVFAMNTCYRTYLVTEGVDPRKHKIAADFERIRMFMQRAKFIEDSMSDTRSKSSICDTRKPKFNTFQETW